MKAKDFIINDDLEIADGDFKIDYSDQQHIESILKAHKGQYYQSPLLGVGIEDNYKGNVNKNLLKKEIRLHLESDNYRVKSIEITGNEELVTSIEAERIK